MAECVSCGKEIPAGKFFCDECYVKMKGRRGPSGEVPRISTEKHEGPEVHERAAKEAGQPPDDTVPSGVAPPIKASGTLTPASGKKVVSMKTQPDKAGKDKGGKKRFAVTITFSERTYAALARLKVRGKKEGSTMEDGAVKARTLSAHNLAKKYGKGPHGRPKLKAVTAASGGKAKPGRGFRGAIAYRDRPMDGGDKAAVAMAVLAILSIIVLSFLPWVKISLGGGEASAMQEVRVAGTDLGAITYACIALSVVALIYMLASRMFGGVFTIVDYGVVFIIIGIAAIPLFYSAIASNARLVGVALEQSGRGGSPIPEQFERQTLWPAYMMVLSGALLALAGLVRLSERKSAMPPPGEEKRGGS